LSYQPLIRFVLLSKTNVSEDHKQNYCLLNCIKLRRAWRCNQKGKIQRNWQHRVHKAQNKGKQSKKHNTTCVWHHYAQTNTNNVNKTCALLQTTAGKDESNIVFMQKS